MFQMQGMLPPTLQPTFSFIGGALALKNFFFFQFISMAHVRRSLRQDVFIIFLVITGTKIYAL